MGKASLEDSVGCRTLPLPRLGIGELLGTGNPAQPREEQGRLCPLLSL